MLTSFELQQIYHKALSLQERFKDAGKKKNIVGKEFDERILARMNKWRQLSSDGDQALFERRLSIAGLQIEQLDDILADKELSEIPTPAWTDMLKEILEAVGKFPQESRTQDNPEAWGFLKEEAPIPFQDFFVPIVQFARAKASVTLKEGYSPILDTANSDLDRLLLSRLAESCGRVLEVEFNTYLALLQLEGLDYREIISNSDSTQYYQIFINRLFDGGLETICCEYPVFARHLVHRVGQWIEIAVEFGERLSTDIEDLRDQLGIPESSRVSHLKPGLSDPHDNGRTVIVAEFETAHKVVYKPKDLGPDAGYFDLVQWLNERGTPYDFKLLHIVQRPDYGWIEFAKQEAIRDEQGASRFYLRSGSLLALLYSLDGLDFHHENVIACNEYPTPIDFETIVQHEAKLSNKDEEMISAAQKSIGRSVLKTHFLPQLYKIRGNYVDISGMGAGFNKEISMEVLKWSNINSDAMGYKLEKASPSLDSEHAPKIGDTTLNPEDYSEKIIQGFSDTYRFICAIQDELLDHESPFTQIFRQPVRYLNRATQLYGSVLSRIAHPSFQRDGIELGIELEVLYRPYLSTDELSPLHPLIEIELAELNRLDIPKFMANADSESIELTDGTLVRSCFKGSPLDTASRKVREFCEADLLWQTELIRSSLAVRTTIEIREEFGRSDERQPSVEGPLLDRGQILDIAEGIADKIRNRAIMSDKGEPSWVTISPSEDEKQFYLDDMKLDLYQGNIGVGVFFAAMEKLNPGKGYGDFVYSTISMSRRWIARARPLDIEIMGIGGVSGLGSVIYGLASISSILDDKPLLEDAIQATKLITGKAINDDTVLDILAGTAGMLSALLALFRATGDRSILDKALQCGRHLVEKRQDIGDGLIAWKPHDDSPVLTGFSHGTAGIAYALLSLYRETQELVFYQAAEEAIAFEDTQYNAKVGNWADNREDPTNPDENKENAFMWGWCNGAPGIALGRIGTLDVFDNKTVRAQIETSVNATASHPHLRSDHLCCGNASLGEVLLSAGENYQYPSWKQAALKLTSTTISRHTSEGVFTPHSVFNELFNPSLFQGSSGFGYHLLRLLEPVDLPNILLLE